MATGALTEQAAEQLEQAAAVTRRIDGKTVGAFWVGMGVGVAVGFYIGYRYNKKKLRAEIYEEADKEIESVREHYRQKTVIVDGQDKPSVAEVVREKGYTIVEIEEPTEPEDARLLPPPVPISPARRTVRPDSTKDRVTTSKDPNAGWDFDAEESRRNDEDPYILHKNEYDLNESGFAQAAYVYYSKDDILVDEDDKETIIHSRENLIGNEALVSFGRGSDDYNTVYVRNPTLELEYEICRVRGSWEEEVAGLDTYESE